MPYDFDRQPLDRFVEVVNQLEIPQYATSGDLNVEYVNEVIGAFTSAFDCILVLDQKIMSHLVAIDSRRSHIHNFVAHFQELQGVVAEEVPASLTELDHRERGELAMAIKKSLIATELTVLAEAVAERGPANAEQVDDADAIDEADADLTAATTVTNSLKALIEKWAKRRWVAPILKAINEVLAIIAGRVD